MLAKQIVGHLLGFFCHYIAPRCGQFRNDKSLGPLEKPVEMAYYVFCPHKKEPFAPFRISGTLTVELNQFYYIIFYIFDNKPWSGSGIH
jgi:hypothetical protein